MPHFVALLRGIGPTNPNMRNDKLARVLESVGCKNVQPVLASGNLVFESRSRAGAPLEAKIEKALASKLGLTIDVLVRSREELAALVKQDPFDGLEHGKEWYLVVTFFKDRREPVCSKFKRDGLTPEFMAEIEKKYGKRITTRTWTTLHKILAKMSAVGD